MGHQTRDRYDVLKSKPQVLVTEQRFDDSAVDTIHALATKFYRLGFIDSGNDETGLMWLRAMDRTNQLVVPMTTDDKWAESAARLLEGLTARGGHYAELARNAVVVVGAETTKVTDARLVEIAAGFKGPAREVVTIPHDEGLKASIVNYGALQPATQRAWLAAGVAVARGL